jgi:hypothetical protein
MLPTSNVWAAKSDDTLNENPDGWMDGWMDGCLYRPLKLLVHLMNPAFHAGTALWLGPTLHNNHTHSGHLQLECAISRCCDDYRADPARSATPS